jgi:hypothetical protein
MAMKSKIWRIGWCVLVVMVATGLAFWRFAREPMMRFPLPDGTELRLEYVTYGTEHTVPGAGRLRAWLSQKAQRWPRLGVPVYAKDYKYPSQGPELCVWFTHFDPRANKYLPAPDSFLVPASLRLQLLEDTGRGEIRSLSNPPWGGNPGKDIGPMPHSTFQMGVYDRRKATVRLRATMQGRTFDMEILNPAAQIAFPRWQPEPLPQTRRVAELEVVLRALSAEYNDNGDLRLNADVDVLRDGQKAPAVSISSVDAMDATGNYATHWDPVVFGEPAWKIRVTMERKEEYPFAVSDGESSAPLSMPGPGESRVLQFPANAKERGQLLAAFVGPGRYVVKDGVFVEAGEPLAEAEAAAFLAAPAPGTARIHSRQPALVHIYETRGYYLYRATKTSGMREPDFSRLRWEGGVSALRRVSGGSRVSEMPGSSIIREVYEFPERDDRGQKLVPPAPGMSVIIQTIPVVEEKVEFVVAPPAKPELRKDKQ